MENQATNPQAQDADSFSKINFNDSGINTNIENIENDITELPLFMQNTGSSASAMNAPLIRTFSQKNTDANNIKQSPIILSPDTNENTPQFMQSLTPLNPDKNAYSSSNLHETYTLSNYYKNDNNTGAGNNEDTDNDLLNNFDTENGKEDSLVKKNLQKKKSQPSVPAKRPAFVVKLWKMVNDPSNDHYISWMEKGDAFQVKDRESFMKYVLPKYFKHNNLASFIRQLNMYGWHKVQDVNSGALVSTEEILQFENPNFIRDREDLLDKIVRNKPGKENEEDEADIKHVMTQLELMKRNQLLISEDLKRVRQDNELLWKENFIARERHKIQSETLDKIMRFLASIYGNNTTRLIEQMTTPGDLVELDETPNSQNGGGSNVYNNPNYPNDYGYYVSTGSTPLNGNNNNSNSSINLNAMNNNSNMGNNLVETGSNSQQLNYYNQNQIQQQQQMYNPSSNKQYPPNQRAHPHINSVARRQLMLTNKSNDNAKPNEIRMNSVGYIPTSGEDVDSSIQEIRRGPETFNNNNSTSSYMDTRPISRQQPQEYSNVNMSVNDSSSSNYPGYRTPLNKPQTYNDGTPVTTVSSVPMYDEPASFNSTRESNMNIRSPVDNNDHHQIMGNIHQQLHKHQGTLKQVHDWLNKYNDHIDSDNLSIPDEFKVDDFLQQPLELTGNSGTPVDYSVDGFINPDTPIHTPVLSHSQLSSNNTSSAELDMANKKRPYNQSNLNDSGDLSSKRFKNVQ